MGKMKVILNPVAGRGYSAKAEPEIRKHLESLKLDYDLVQTREKWHAAELAKQAKRDKFDVVVAVGGDGTTNEVINGLLAASDEKEVGTLGLIATGSGSDFMHNVGIPAHIEQACRLLAQGRTRIVDIGKLALDSGNARYFDNQLGIGFDGVVTVEAKKFKRLRGMALYLPVVLKTVFVTNKATRVTIDYDGQQLKLPTLQISIVNGSREGGGFYMSPEAKIDDGLFDICVVREVSKLAMLGLIPHFMKGTHVSQEPVQVLHAKKVTVSSEDNLIAHFDGELLCTAGHRIECEIVPQRLKVIY